MNNISAAIGRGNLAHLDELMAHTNKLGEIYRSYGLFSHTWLAGGLRNDYNGLKKELNDAGYEMGQHHYRNDLYTVFGGKVNDCPVMDEIENKYFFVPLHYGVTEEQAHLIGSICQKYI